MAMRSEAVPLASASRTDFVRGLEGFPLVPVLYVLSFGPACWIADRVDSGFAYSAIAAAYRPIAWVANRSKQVSVAALWYVGLAEADSGHKDVARDLWSRLLAEMPANAPGRDEVEQRLAALKTGAAK